MLVLLDEGGTRFQQQGIAGVQHDIADPACDARAVVRGGDDYRLVVERNLAALNRLPTIGQLAEITTSISCRLLRGWPRS